MKLVVTADVEGVLKKGPGYCMPLAPWGGEIGSPIKGWAAGLYHVLRQVPSKSDCECTAADGTQEPAQPGLCSLGASETPILLFTKNLS